MLSMVNMNESYMFQCSRCSRYWTGTWEDDTIPCVCHLDCDYCGEIGTVVEGFDAPIGFKFEDGPSTLKPHVLETWGICSNCGYHSPKKPWDAVHVEMSWTLM